MTENTATAPVSIVLTAECEAIIRTDVRAFKTDSKRYLTYVTEMGVTLETLPAHVALFRDAYRASFPKSKPADPAAVKAYATKVRNGLKYNLPKVDRDAAETDYLAALVKAADKAVENGVDADAIRTALASILA